MANNPFRGNPVSKTEDSIAEWGKVKFKPTKFGGGRNKNFNNNHEGKGNNAYNRKFGNGNGNFNKNKDSYKFNQVSKDAIPESATPWNKFKDEIVFKQREEEQANLQANMDSEDAKRALKQREANYRKLLIEQKKQEPTKWENFADEGEGDTSNNAHKSLEKANSSAKNKKSKAANKNIQTLDSKSKISCKKNIPNYQVKGKVKEIIPQELLNNFDSKKLSYEQNDQMRKLITKNTILTYGCSLQSTIKDLKRKKAKKDKA